MQLMVRLYGTYPPVRILKAQLHRTHDSLHDKTGIVSMNATFHPINKLHHLLDFFAKNVQSLLITCELLQHNHLRAYSKKMAIHSKNACANASVERPKILKLYLRVSYNSGIILSKMFTYYFQNYAGIIGAGLIIIIIYLETKLLALNWSQHQW